MRYGAGDGAYGEPSLDGRSLGGGSYQTTGALPTVFYGDGMDIWSWGYSYNTGQAFFVDNTIHFP
jgi:hypothetical protein